MKLKEITTKLLKDGRCIYDNSNQCFFIVFEWNEDTLTVMKVSEESPMMLMAKEELKGKDMTEAYFYYQEYINKSKIKL